jgi:hypothetical protein
MTEVRDGPTSTLLADGRVLVTGGYHPGPGSRPLASAELYDPATGIFTATGSMTTARNGNTATLLTNGKVLVTGGAGWSSYLASAELFDPATGNFTATGSMTSARTGHKAILLADGRVLIIGGHAAAQTGFSYVDDVSAETYDPATGKFSAAGSMSDISRICTVTLLRGGSVLITGASQGSGEAYSTAEIYDPTSRVFTPTGSMLAHLGSHSATLLLDGKVLIAAARQLSGIEYFRASLLYDPNSGKFAVTGFTLLMRDSVTATLLRDGRVLIVGGEDQLHDNRLLASAELYDPATGQFTPTGSMATARIFQTATRLADGRVLIAGGFDGTDDLTSAELYWP